jgi:hypothetical protein
MLLNEAFGGKVALLRCRSRLEWSWFAARLRRAVGLKGASTFLSRKPAVGMEECSRRESNKRMTREERDRSYRAFPSMAPKGPLGQLTDTMPNARNHLRARHQPPERHQSAWWGGIKSEWWARYIVTGDIISESGATSYCTTTDNFCWGSVELIRIMSNLVWLYLRLTSPDDGAF